MARGISGGELHGSSYEELLLEDQEGVQFSGGVEPAEERSIEEGEVFEALKKSSSSTFSFMSTCTDLDSLQDIELTS